MTTQEGKFYAGTYGYPIRIRLGVRIVSSDVTSISLVLTRPNGTKVDVTLPHPDSITNPNIGEITYTPEDGDLSIRGSYIVDLAIMSSGNQQLTARATMIVL